MNPSRRKLLQSAAGIAGGLAFNRATPAASPPLLPTVRLGKHEVTRLICGANPFYGYSHFNALLDAHMREWMTQERVIDSLRQCELSGLNTWQFHYSERSVADFRRYRAGGGKMQCLILSMKQDSDEIRVASSLQPIGIAHHGGVTDNKFRDGRMNEVQDYLKAVRDSGVMVGLSSHNPMVIEYVEDKGWDIDFYMTCFYRVSRTHEEIVRELGEAPLGELFLENDPERMTAVVRKTRKPCLGFKILAAGRRTNKPEQVAQAFEYALAKIKPTDAVIVGMYPRYRDEARENAEHLRRAHAKLN
jgi:hypothetical protein